jgi:YVTN family beta-propeller protein
MIKRSALIIISVLALIFSSCKTREENANLLNHQWLAEAPAYTLYTQINKAGETIIPNGRIITPSDRTFQVAPHPYGLSLSHDGNTIVTANSGTSPLSITIIRDINDEQPEIQQIPEGAKTDKGILASVFMGLAISPDNKIVYVGGGQENKIFLFDITTGEKAGYIDCSTDDEENDYSHGYIGDLVLSRDGKTLYAVDQTNFRMIIADTETAKVTGNVKVGRYPFGITLSPDEKKIYVANVGMFEYKKITGADFDNLEETALEFPPFAYLSEEATHGIHTDTLEIPGIGEPNVPEAFSVWIISLESEKPPKVIAKIKTGHLVGALIEGIPAVGGSSPNSLVATSDYVFVSNGNNDNISVIDIKNDSLLQHIQLTLDRRIDHLRGIIPFGLALSPDNKRLYVAESGINAIGVIDVESKEVIGHIPAGWFPSKLKVSRDGKKLIVANAKGYGSGPNGGPEFTVGPEGSYIGSLMKGTVSVINIPSDQELIQTTQQVISNNFTFNPVSSEKFLWRKENPVPIYPGNKPSPIKHIVFISKENRTFDEIFGQIENGKGEPSLARYGKNVTFSNQAKTKTVTEADVMPNHLTLAKKYAIADNFYVDSDVSADGHRWLVNTYPNEWVETNTAASYGGNRNFNRDSKAPGALGMTGAAGAIYPEDYNEAGSMWEHLERHEIDFYNFGFGTMFEPAVYLPSFKYTGIKHIYNFPLPEPMFYKTSRLYATYNMAIPDQFRIDMFIKEFTEKWIEGEDKLPPVITVIIPNDHGAGERPEAGYPFKESYMSDNDLAVGRIVEFLSGTSYWKEMAIFITEDDAQGGVDHIDAHRSILMVISPFAKKNYVGHVHYSFGSIFKTFWNILGIPYLNQYDAGATDLADMFADTTDYTPYNAIPVDELIFDPQKALDPFDEKFNWKAIEESPVLDDVKVMLKDSKEFDEKQDEKK